MTRNSATSSIAAVAAAVLVALVGATPANARSNGFSITPARIDARVHAGSLLPPVVVRNDTNRTLDIGTTVLLAGQDLSGLPTWKLTPATARAGAKVARISPRAFRLKPHTARSVRLRVLAGKPRRGQGTYGVLLVSAVPVPTSTGGASVVATRVRLSANLLLRYGGGGAPLATAESLRAGQGAKQSLLFAVGVRNAGDIHGRPRAAVQIRDAAGRIVARKRFASGNVLPGAERELMTAITRVLPAGDYTARATVSLGGRRSSKSLPLHLVAPGTLPTPDLRIDSLPVPTPQASEPITVKLGLRNAGTAPAAIAGVATLGAPDAGLVKARVRIASSPLAAGARRTIELRLPAAGTGAHELTVRLRDGSRVIATRSVVFDAAKRLRLWDRFRDWASAHVGTLLAALAVLLLLVAVAAVAVGRRAVRRAREETLKSLAAAADTSGGGRLPNAVPPSVSRHSPLIGDSDVPGLSSPGLDDPQRVEARRPGWPQPAGSREID